MSSLETRKIEPQSGTTVTLGAGGDTVLVSASQLKTNTVKDAGGNALFTSDGAGTFSSVNSAIAGSMIFISSQTASSSATVEFTSGIDSTYDEYMFVFTDINAATDATQFSFQVNAVGASGFNETVTSTWFHAVQQEADGWAGLEYQAGNDQAQGTGYQYLPVQMGSGADESAAGILHLYSPSSTTYVKQFYARFNNYGQDNTARDSFIAGYFNLTTAIDEISFKMSSGSFDGTIAMYGIT